jgi:hypothetical protein
MGRWLSTRVFLAAPPAQIENQQRHTAAGCGGAVRHRRVSDRGRPPARGLRLVGACRARRVQRAVTLVIRMPTRASSNAKAPIPLISCWTGRAPGVALRSGLKLTAVVAAADAVGAHTRLGSRSGAPGLSLARPRGRPSGGAHAARAERRRKASGQARRSEPRGLARPSGPNRRAFLPPLPLHAPEGSALPR